MFDTSIHYEVYTEEPHIPDLCAYAEHFDAWCSLHVRRALMYQTHVVINQALILITKKYREYRDSVPRAHRNRISEVGHVCIFHIWDRNCRALEAIEIDLAPPQLYLPVPVAESKELIVYDEPPTSILGELIH